MVVAVFPLAKIGLLLMKQLSRPIANYVKNEAKKHPKVRKHVIAPLGRAYNWAETKAKGRRSSDHASAHISEEDAVELGANAVGEIVLFGLLSLILLLEISRQGDKKAVREKTKEEEMGNLQDMVLGLNSDVTDLKKSIESIKKALEDPPDIFELEEQRHSSVTDYDFWDTLTKRKNTPTHPPHDSGPNF